MVQSTTPPLDLNGSTLTIPRASSTQNGYLSKEDFILFSTESAVAVNSFNTRTGEVVLLEDDVLAALGYVPLNKAGDTMSGPLTLSGPPSSSLHAATKAYADSLASGGSVFPGDILLSSFNASGSGATYTGSISAGSQTLTVNVATDFVVGQGIYIAAAGTAGQPLITKVDAVSGTTITIHDAAVALATNQKVQHDDTAAWQTALDALGTAGGGRLLAFAGRLRDNKPPSTYSAILQLPFNLSPNVTPRPGAAMYSIIGNMPLMAGVAPVKGTIIETEVRNTAAWIMSAGAFQTDFWQANMAYIFLENILFRTYDNPEINCLDLNQVWSVTLKDIGCDTGQAGIDAMTFPSHNTMGVRLPIPNNCTMVYTERLVVRGFGVGVVGSELWRSVLTWVEHCNIGIQSHDIDTQYPTVGDFLIGNCVIGINVKAKLRLNVHLSFEQTISGPYFPREGGSILDPNDVCTGIVQYYCYQIGGTVAPISWTGCTAVTIWSTEGYGIKWAKQKYFQLEASTDLQVRDLVVRRSAYLNDGSAEEVVSFGAAGSGTAGFRQAIVPNIGATPSLRTGLVSYWKFEEPSGIRYDQTGTCNLHPPSYTDVATNAPGKIGNCLYSSSPSVYLYAGINPAVFSASFSVAGWINVQVAGFNPIIGAWPNDGINNSFLLQHQASSVDFVVSANGNTATAVSAPFTAVVGTWYFLAGVFDSTANQIKISLNGAAFATVPFTGPIYRMAKMNLTAMIFGSTQAVIKMDEFGLWSKALTISEVAALYAGGAGFSYPF